MDPEKDPLAYKEPERKYARIGSAMQPQPTVEVLLIENEILCNFTTVTHEGTRLLCNHFDDQESAMSFLNGWFECTEEFEIGKGRKDGNVTTWIATRIKKKDV